MGFDVLSIVQMIGGLALFIYGMTTMGKGLERAAGSKLEKTLEKMTGNAVTALLMGMVVTMVIQSSSATTVMVVGFVNAGIMTLKQSVGVILGANIGTTITAQILRLSGGEGSGSLFMDLLKPKNLAYIIVLVGVIIMMIAKKRRTRDIADIFTGFGILFIGMSVMEGAVAPLADLPQFADLFAAISNPVLGVLVGAGVTAIIQSSSASVGILQALCLTGMVPFSAALPIIMGQNIGTCITAILSAIGASKNAKRAAMVHLYFNLIGTMLFMAVFYAINAAVHFSFMTQAATPAGIAILHSAFNITATLVLLPFGKALEKLACLTIRDRKEEQEKVAADPDFMILESRFLEKPAFAVEQSRNAAKKMAEDSHRTLFTALDLLKNFSVEGKALVEEAEKKVDRYEDELGTYLVKLNQKDLSVHDSHSVSIMLHCIGDFERISDHGVNIMESAQELYEKGLKFSDKALEELRVMEHAVEDIVDIAYKVYENQDVQLAREIEPLEEVIDELSKELKYRHIQRLRAGECTIEMGFILSDVTTSLERVADHCSNIGVCVTQVHEDAFDTHQHLKQIKHGPDETFYRELEVVRSQYQLPEIKDEPAAAQIAAAGSQ